MGIQVYTATHGGEGQPLSNLEKAFISFEFGGKKIEDFNFLSVTPGDRLHRGISAPYSDITSEQEGMDGQLWWGGKYEPLVLDFTLATDGVTARELNEFSAYFKPGIKRELVLSEHPNRAIEARVASIPEYDFLPFESEITRKIGNTVYTSRTTIYKGELNISFICDYPFWHSIRSYVEQIFNGQKLSKEDQVNVMLEDGIPLQNMVTGNGEFSPNYIFWDTIARFTSLTSKANYSLYYCGTAPAYPTINFSHAISKTYEINNTVFNRVSLGNGFATKNGKPDFSEPIYSSLKIEDNTLQYSLPSVFTAVNQALDIVAKYGEGDSALDLQRNLRENVYHYGVRAAAVRIMSVFLKGENQYINIQTNVLNKSIESDFAKCLLAIIPDSFNVDIDCKMGETTVSYTLGQIENINLPSNGGIKTSDITLGEALNISKEKAGDMIKSNYLKIEGADYFTDDGKTTTHRLTSSDDIKNFKITYKYMYV